ncbi:hypothetical protein DPMN_052954 [Dreissena polymorpha]|uniref:Coiled-coil domain-containing protein 181 n=1 Tax=Dreissena polymorpha TaxID=45954 RepID=A0A9D4HPR7_DREPO|nr:hypothetical protein DPMN_052954 [Dreissena polymorpha]
MADPTEQPELDDFEKELDSYIQTEEKHKMEQQEIKKSTPDSGQSERLTMDRSPTRDASDNEDSEVDDYNLTEDQKRALEELDNLKTEMGYPDEDPPDYDVKERLKVLNEDLKNDPTPLEKQKDSKVVFKDNLIDLVAPAPDYGEESGAEDANSPRNAKPKPTQNQPEDKVDEKSETVQGGKKSTVTNEKKDTVLIEIDGQIRLVSSDDVYANDLGLSPIITDSNKSKGNESKSNTKTVNSKENKENKPLQPAPPNKPRPATATTSRRTVKAPPQKARPQSAHNTTDRSNPDYSSPYALSPREKQLLEERKKALEKQKVEAERRKKKEEEDKDRENRDAFEFWLKKKRESDRRKKIEEEEDRKKNNKEDRGGVDSEDGTETDYNDWKQDNEEAFKTWLKEKSVQFKKEKLLKRRQEQEMHDGYYVRSREECEKAYKLWLKQKAIDARKARAAERAKAKLQRLAARRARKSISLSKSIRESNSFRYVDYYGYRF